MSSGLLALLAAMRVAGVERLIFSSTAATYGVPHTLPIREEDPAAPINPYGQSKLAVDMAITGAARAPWAGCSQPSLLQRRWRSGRLR